MEIELKLSLEPAAVPALRGHPLLLHYRQRRPRTQTLDNEYHDTPGLDLWRQGIELRLRRQGGRALQTLKVLRAPLAGDRAPGGLHRLDEWEVPLAPIGPPALDIPTLIDWLPRSAAAVGDAVRRAVAQPGFGARVVTHYERTTWPLMSVHGDLVELALDTGEIRAGGRVLPLCEVELELRSGQERALFELAHALHSSGPPLRIERRGKAERGFALLAGEPAAGPRTARTVPLSRTMPWPLALRAIVEECLAQVQGNEAGVVGAADAEFVHQMRVGLRRLRSALGLFKALAEPPEAVLADLRWSAGQLGAARDAEVLVHDTLPRVPAPVPEDPRWPALLAAAGAEAASARQGAIEAVRSPRHVGWQLALMDWVCGLGDPDPGRAAQAGGAAQGKPASAQDAVRGVEDAAGAAGAKSLSEVAARRLRRLRRRLVRDGRQLQEADPAARHDARIAAKKLRYATEMLGALQPDVRRKVASRRLRGLAALQQQLGLLNDAEVAAARLAGLAARNPALAAAAAYAQGWLAADAAQRVQRLGRLWRRVREAI